MVTTRTRQAAHKPATISGKSPNEDKGMEKEAGSKRKKSQGPEATDAKMKQPDTSSLPPALRAAGKTPITSKRGKRREPSQDDSDAQVAKPPKHNHEDNNNVEKVISKTIEKVVPRSTGGMKNVENADNKKEAKVQEPVRRQSSRKKSIEMSNKENSTGPRKSKTTTEKQRESKEFVTTRRYRPQGDEADFRESQEDVLLRQITNPAIVDKPRQRAPPKHFNGRSPKASEILRDYIPTTFAMSPSPGNEASGDDPVSHKKAIGKRKSRVDAMIAAEKRRLNTAGLARIGEHTQSALPPVTSGYASLVSPARNFSHLISPSPAHKLKPKPRPVASSYLSVPERGNLNDLSPLSMRTSRSVDATPAPDTSLFSLLSTPVPSSQNQQHSSSFSSSPTREVASTPRTLSKLVMKDILAAASPSMPPPPPRRFTRASIKHEAPPPKPASLPAKSELPPAHEPLGPEEALEEALSLMKRKKPAAVKKRKTKEEEAAEEELTTKAQSEVESAKSFFEDLDAEPVDSFLEFE